MATCSDDRQGRCRVHWSIWGTCWSVSSGSCTQLGGHACVLKKNCSWMGHVIHVLVAAQASYVPNLLAPHLIPISRIGRAWEGWSQRTPTPQTL
jgi:hypothetical protein